MAMKSVPRLDDCFLIVMLNKRYSASE